jgi:hypothetical protein
VGEAEFPKEADLVATIERRVRNHPERRAFDQVKAEMEAS